MSTDDILYDPIKSPDGIKTITVNPNSQVEIEILVTTRNGIETREVKRVTVTSGGPPAKTTVVVDGNTVVAPPVYADDYCCYMDCG